MCVCVHVCVRVCMGACVCMCAAMLAVVPEWVLVVAEVVYDISS